MAKNRITKEEVEKIAELTNLELSNEETKKLAGMFSETLTYMDMLNELDTSEVAETYQVTGLVNVFQNGEIEKSLTEAEVFKNKKGKNNYFVAKAVFER